MNSPHGYSLGKCLHSGPRSEVYAAVRAADARDVVLKSYLDHDPVEADARARREFDALRRLRGPGVPEALELSAGQGRPVLVLESFPGVTLDAWVGTAPPPPESFLEVAIQLVDAIARTHEARLLHRDLQPANVLVDRASLETRLLGFECVRPLGAAARESVSESSSAVLPYLSPEATGRMGRGVDSRSDLYSLGATLYFALTARPPFDSSDMLSLVHAHFAKMPIAPAELRPGLPGTLSRIVLKLLQKSPEDRYQTAHALRSDLADCREQLARAGCIAEDFALASGDAPHRPLFAGKLHGRAGEIRRLREAYARAAQGLPEVLVLQGAAGSGKSALLRELRAPLVESFGYLALGSFDAYRRDLPYAGFAQALGSLAEQLLTESDARLARWRRELRAALSPIAAALLPLVPDLGLVLGEVPAVPQLGPAETRARLMLAVQRFVQVMAAPEHPLVLALDDLQWADAESLDLLRGLLLGLRRGALFAVGAYRSAEVASEHPVALLFEELEVRGVGVQKLALGPLGEQDSANLLAEALGRSVAETGSLAAAVTRKTGNTPLLIQQFIDHLYDRGLIRFQGSTGWTWDDAEVVAAGIPDDAVEWMTAKIARLPEAVGQVLQLASCAGEEFDVDGLAELTDRPRESIEGAVFALCDEGLIAPAQRGLRFVHQRIREAARALLSPGEQGRLHHQAARLLLARTSPAALPRRLFEIADHLNRAGDRLNELERLRAVEINVRAGKSALLSGAASTAAHYFAAARECFRDRDWKERAALGFDLLFQSAESALQTRQFSAALDLLDALERQPLGSAATAQVAAKRILVHTRIQTPEQTLPLVLEALARFGVRWPANPGRWRLRWEIWRTDRALRGPLDERSFRPLGPGDHGGLLAKLMLMTAGGATLAVCGLQAVLSVCFALRACRRHGYAAPPGHLLAGYNALRIRVLGASGAGERYAQAALEWSERAPDPILAPRAEYLLDAFHHAWTRPRRSVLEPLRLAAERMLEVGDLEYAQYALFMRATHLALAGESLELLERAHAALEKQASDPASVPHLQLRRGAALLTRPLAAGASLEAELAAVEEGLAGMATARMGCWGVWIQMLAALGRFERILQLAADASRFHSVGPDAAFLCGLAAGALAADPRAAARSRLRRQVRESLRELDAWAKRGPDFEHMARGLRAEHRRLRGDSRSALSLYTEAAKRASVQGYVQHAALLYERRAELLISMRRGTEAASALKRAVLFYEQWGALQCAQQLRERAAQLGCSAGPGPARAAEGAGS